MTPQQLKALRLQLGLTQAEMAKRLHISLPLYSLYERDKQKIHERTADLAARILSDVKK